MIAAVVLTTACVGLTALLTGCAGQDPAVDSYEAAASCGNGKAQGPEDCDGTDLRGKTCSSFGYTQGLLKCNTQCVYDFHQCSTCGDGIVGYGEQCDDQNQKKGDCCDACRAEPGCEIEPDATVLPAGGEVSGWLPPGDEDRFTVPVPAGQTALIDATVTNGCATLIDIIDAAGVVRSSSPALPGLCPRALAQSVGPGPAVVRLRRAPDAPAGPLSYHVRVKVTFAPCGDGIVQPGQDCDDGNHVDGDGCSAACRLEAAADDEPNDLPYTHLAVRVPPFEVSGVSAAPGDCDVYPMQLPAAAELQVEIFGPGCEHGDLGASVVQSINPFNPTPLATGSPATGCVFLPSASPGVAPFTYTADRWFLRICGGATAPYAYTARVTNRSLCGNGVVEGRETCDGPGCDAFCGAPCGPEPYFSCPNQAPRCGDLRVQLGEDCDGGPCCTSTCRLAAGPGCEIEPNDVLEKATPIGLQQTLSGNLAATDVDWYKLDIPAWATVGFQVGPDWSTAWQDLNLDCALLTPDGQTVYGCSFSGRVPPGRAYLRVARNTDTTTRAYTLSTQLDALCGNGVTEPGEDCDPGPGCNDTCMLPHGPDAVCGNGVLEPPEQCDDGNRIDGDGCSSWCAFEGPPFAPVCGNGWVEPGEDCDDGNTLDGDGCDSTCHFPPVCGDGRKERGEQCDDGNLVSGDGCDATCHIEPGHVFETEPNEDGTPQIATDDFSILHANGPFTGTTFLHGAIDPPGDEDVFAILNNGTATVTVRLETSEPGGACPTIDTVLRVRDAARALLAYDDDSGLGLCSKLEIALAPGTTVYAQVSDHGDNSFIAAYALTVTFLGAAP
jgi:cysteine-rich repeat protein